ncbi:MAG TPA: hypothetical protein VKR22_05505 [Acidimicrobiales bacterium]|nr:hypothetical protein [Acidimicrobiales bacterium]
MKHRLFRNRIAAGAALTMATLAGTLTLTAGVASASGPADPTFGAAPQFYNGNPGSVVRTAGSDTTYYMTQSLTDLFNGAALYGCNVASPAAFPCPSGGNTSTSDVFDNWDRVEVTTGADLIGSGAGQNQLCGLVATPDPVDIARSSKPNGNNCPQETIAQGYAYDGVPAVDFTNVNPAAFGHVTNTSSPWYGAIHSSANESAQNGTDGCTFTTFPSPSCDLMGPVAKGWVPGNNVNGPYTGTAFTNLNNNDNGGGAQSTAYRLYCATGGSGATAQITDWGSLTNGGTSLSIPVRIMGVNPSSGTVATFATFVNSGVATGTECNSGAKDTNLNDATFNGSATKEIALENNAAQIGDFLVTDYPNDAADQAAELATTIYFMSEGPIISNPNVRQVTVYNNGNPSTGVPTSFGETKMKLNNVAASSITEGNKTFPTARALFQMALGYQAPAQDNTAARSLTVTDATFGSGSNQLTSPSAQFQVSDIGRAVSGAGIPTGTYITQVAPNLVGGTALPTNTAELSQPTTASSAGESVTFSGHIVGLKASTANYMNWICSTTGDGVTSLQKARDLVTGLNYDTEITNLIDNTYGFNRITDVQAGSWAGDCGLIYPTWSAHATPSDGGSAATNPYPGGVATTPLPNVTSGTYNGLTGAIPFPDN